MNRLQALEMMEITTVSGNDSSSVISRTCGGCLRQIRQKIPVGAKTELINTSQIISSYLGGQYDPSVKGWWVEGSQSNHLYIPESSMNSTYLGTEMI